jgi:hypothetical protein
MEVLQWLSALIAWGPFVLIPLAIVGFTVYQMVGMLRQPSAGPLHDRYPPARSAPGTKLTMERVVFGRGPRMTWVKIGADHAYLHVKLVYSLRLRGGFSVPLSAVTAEPDRFPLMILKPDVVRLTFARDPDRPMLVWYPLFDRLSAASQGRLKLAQEKAAALSSS